MVNSGLRQGIHEALRVSSESGVSNSAPTSNGPNWSLSNPPCCNTDQSVIIGLICGYSVLIFVFWRFKFMLPLKLLSVYLHEFGHASAAWLTCGSVVSMEVHSDEGGVTKTKGGNRMIILLAGYLGSAFWGMFFTLTAANEISVQVAAGMLVVGMLVMMYFAENNTLRFLIVGFLLLIAGCWACQLLTTVHLLQYFMLLVGVVNGLFAPYDCYDDLISRRVNGSDAVEFAKITKTSSRCWGVIWLLISLCFMGLGIYFALVIASD